MVHARRIKPCSRPAQTKAVQEMLAGAATSRMAKETHARRPPSKKAWGTVSVSISGLPLPYQYDHLLYISI
jgi:hypothetical protein